MTKLLLLLAVVLVDMSVAYGQSCGKTQDKDFPGSFVSSTSEDPCGTTGGGGSPGVIEGDGQPALTFQSPMIVSVSFDRRDLGLESQQGFTCSYSSFYLHRRANPSEKARYRAVAYSRSKRGHA